MVSGLRPSILGVDHWFWMILIPKHWWHSDGKAAGWVKLTPSLDGYPNQYSLPCLDPETPSNLTHTPSHTPSLFSPYPTAPGRTPICPVESKLWKLPQDLPFGGDTWNWIRYGNVLIHQKWAWTTGGSTTQRELSIENGMILPAIWPDKLRNFSCQWGIFHFWFIVG